MFEFYYKLLFFFFAYYLSYLVIYLPIITFFQRNKLDELYCRLKNIEYNELY